MFFVDTLILDKVLCAVYVGEVVNSVCFCGSVELVNDGRVSDIVATSKPIGMVDCLAVDTLRLVDVSSIWTNALVGSIAVVLVRLVLSELVFWFLK